MRHEPVHVAQKSKNRKRLIIFFSVILTSFCSKRVCKRFETGETSFARQTQFNAANKFMPRFVRYFGLFIIHDCKFELPVKTYNEMVWTQNLNQNTTTIAFL